ncbi:aspartic peptidase domain-containing protein [Chlamydoabsidia padenii]|nr:aspartic peptidase domain-containing protein [Chlamydoabsidia padenii]
MQITSSLFAIASIFVLAINAESPPGRHFKMELEKKTGKIWNTPARINSILSKYGMEDENKDLGSASIVDLDSVFVDVEYLGTIGVGSPPQYFKMNLDTGSADIWIPAEPCETCLGHNIFNPKQSSSFLPINETWSLRYGDGSGVRGVTAGDTIKIGDVSVANQTIGLANALSPDFVNDRYMDGIIGLAFPSLSYTGETQSVVERLYEAGAIAEPVVGVFLGHIGDAGGKGEAVFGGVNPDHYTGNVKYIPVTQKKYWQVDFGGIEIGDQSIPTTKVQAIIDTGTTLTVLTPALSKAFHDAIPGANYDTMYGWIVPCKPANGNQVVTFNLGGMDFPVRIVDMIRERSSPDDPSLCYSGVAEANSNLVIMGDTFLRNYYSVYDFKQARIGLAPSKA